MIDEKQTKQLREFCDRGKYENAPWYSDTIHGLCDEIDRLNKGVVAIRDNKPGSAHRIAIQLLGGG